MDGQQTKLTSSLQFRLGLSLTVVITIAALIAGSIGFHSAFADANELQDDQLREVAAMVDANLLKFDEPDAATRSEESDPESHLALQWLEDPTSGNGSSTEAGVSFPHDLHNGMQTVNVNRIDWRVFVKTTRTGKRLAVGQQTAVRDEIADHAGTRTVMPLVVLIPSLILLIIVLVRTLLAPVTKLARQLDSRAQTDIEPLDDKGIPSELKPFIASINHMLKRVAAAMEQQRRFVADAAHELRSPLTALSLQAENLANAELPKDARTQLNAMNTGLMRARTLVSQLLLLARAQLAQPNKLGPVELRAVAREVFEEVMPFAESRDIDLGVTHTCNVSVLANPVDVNTVIRNLVDNAIRYGGEGGQVDVSLYAQEKWAVIEVQDNGPGIPDSERGKVFDPFYRLAANGESGSGLGLSIVKGIVERLCGEVSLTSNTTRKTGGTIVSVRLPLYQP
jgi:two-component system OmpR family sensor kinase